jgi:hypothetical protein
MFRIPLKLGKNNDIIENLSEIDGTTDRDTYSRRSLDEIVDNDMFNKRIIDN